MKSQRGITLVALIITIIVMLILVGVTVSVALNGGLFTTTKNAAKGTQIEADRETLQSAIVGAMDTNTLEIPNRESLSENLPDVWSVTGEGPFICTSPNGNKFIVNKNGEDKFVESKYIETIEGLAEGVSVVPYEELTGDIKLAAETGKLQAVLKEAINGEETIAVVPTGFEISTEEGENSISGGLVIKDGANEFVFVPVTSTYTEDNLGPLTGTDSTSNCVYDSQEQLDYYYGKDYFNYSEDFNYEQDKTNIETSINKYKGFYVGRYETTIDKNGSIGSMKDTTVLTANKTIAQTNNKAVRWYGLYKVEKDLYADDESVFSTMITSKEWDVIMDYTKYGDARRGIDTYTIKPDLSGSVYKDSNPVQYDVNKNIYDLAGNVYELTLKPYGSDVRVSRGRFLLWQLLFSIWKKQLRPEQ